MALDCFAAHHQVEIDMVFMGDTDAELPSFDSSTTATKQPDYATCDENVFDIDQDNKAGGEISSAASNHFVWQQLVPAGSSSPLYLS